LLRRRLTEINRDHYLVFAAALASITLFVGMIVVWAQVLAVL
jgi:hypothetical protein